MFSFWEMNLINVEQEELAILFFLYKKYFFYLSDMYI